METVEVGERPVDDDEGRPRRWRPWLAAAAVVVVLIAGVAAVVWSRRSEPAPVAESVRCSVHWRAAPTEPPSNAGEVSFAMRNPPLGTNEQRLAAGSMTFTASVPNIDPGFRAGAPGGDLVVSVADGQGRTVAHQLFQIWTGPTNEFGGGTGFTGLVYVNDPETGAEVQYTCSAS